MREWERACVQKYLQKGKCKSGCWPHCLTFLETTSTHAYSHKQMIFNLTSGSPCTAKARENDEHRKKSSERITMKTRKRVIQLKRAKGIARKSVQLQRSKKSRRAKQCWLTVSGGMDRLEHHSYSRWKLIKDIKVYFDWPCSQMPFAFI